MCFSAPASFIAGSVLCAAGAATIVKVKTKTDLPFAMVPLLFGIQQLTEGVIWLTFSPDWQVLNRVMTYLYSIFSHVIWPFYIPFAIVIMEEVKWRRHIITGFLTAGIFVGLYLLYFILTRPVIAEVIGKHIVYKSPHFYEVPAITTYLLATCVSCFFSSHNFVRLFGACMLLSFILVRLIHVYAFFSIWCFFAAGLSLLVYFHLKLRKYKVFEMEIL